MQAQIASTTEKRLQKKFAENKSILDQVVEDLLMNLTKFKDAKKGLKVVSRKTEIHEKTLSRIIAKENKPGYITLYKLYRYLLETDSDTEVLEKAPFCISEYLRKQNPKNTNKGIEFSTNIAQEILQDRAWTEIFFMAGAGKVTRDEVKELFGSYGLQTVEKMRLAGVLEETSVGIYKLGQVQANLTAEILKTAGLRLTETFFKPEASDEQGENFMGLFAEGLSLEAYNEWLKIDEEAFNKKVALSKLEKNQGSHRVFTFMVSEKMLVGKRF